MDAIFEVFEPMNVASVRDHADFIPGALDAIAALRARGLRIGIDDRLHAPDHGRSWRRSRAAERLRAGGDRLRRRPAGRAADAADDVVRDGDDGRVAGAHGGEGRRHPAGHRARASPPAPGPSASALTGNIAGLSAEELATLTQAERAQLRRRAEADLLAAGADLVIDSVADLPRAVDVIEAKLRAGDRPRKSDA